MAHAECSLGRLLDYCRMLFLCVASRLAASAASGLYAWAIRARFATGVNSDRPRISATGIERGLKVNWCTHDEIPFMVWSWVLRRICSMVPSNQSLGLHTCVSM